MSDEKALLAAIWEYPHEDTPRLVYADWLQETGNPANVARAEFIRLQCAIARFEWHDPARAALLERATVLQKKHGGKWKAGLPSRLRSVRYWRGFPQPSRTIRASDLDTVPTSEWNAVPLWNISLTQYTAPELTALAANPKLLRVGTLELDAGRRGKPLDPEGATALLRSPHARNLGRLDFTSTALRLPTLEALFASPALRNLRDLSFCCCGLSGDVIPLLMGSAVPEQLTGFDLQGNRFTGPDLQPFFECAARFIRLTSLGLGWTPHPTLPALDFASFPPLPALRSLHTGTGGDLIAFTKWPGLATLQRLSLHGGRGIGPAEARALIASPHLQQLRALSCGFASGSAEETLKLLKSCFGAAVSG
jgi:uncharacterized protein (TIGR02996 family)